MGVIVSALLANFKRADYNPTTDIPDLTGKVAIVTGGNTGIGYHTVAELVRHGAKVYMGARNESRATGAIAQMKAEGVLDAGKGQVEWLNLDLSTVTSSRAAGEMFMQQEKRLDILIHNAGLMPSNPEGFLLAEGKIPVSGLMSTNHLGPFVLTKTLLPILEATAAEPGSDVRVVTLSSMAHATPIKMDWKSAEQWAFKPTGFIKGMKLYGMTKLANILFAKELQRRFDREDIPAMSIVLQPGSVFTAGATAGVIKLFHLPKWVVNTFAKRLLYSPSQGAYTSLFAATSPAVKARRKDFSGAYLEPFGVISEASREGRDPVAARDLWETSERVAAAM